MRVLTLLLTLLTFMATACATQQAPPTDETTEPRDPVEVEATIDRAVATTGDVLTYTITVNHDPKYEIDAPETGAEIAGFRIIDTRREEPRTVARRTVVERWYKLRADLVGSYVLPAVTIRYKPKEGADLPEGETGEAGEVKTSEIFVEVESVLPAEGEEEASDIRDLKPLRSIDEPVPWWWWAAGGGVLVLLLGLLIWALRRKKKARPAAPPRPAHEVAFHALNQLRETDFEDPEAVRRFHFQISEVLRAYVEARFQLNATDLTTEEILPEIPHLLYPPEVVPGGEGTENKTVRRPLEAEEGERLRRFLDATDRVKFAAHEPTSEEIQAVYDDALSFVEATRPPSGGQAASGASGAKATDTDSTEQEAA